MTEQQRESLDFLQVLARSDTSLFLLLPPTWALPEQVVGFHKWLHLRT